MMHIRAQFPIFNHQPDLVWLDSASSAQKPESVIAATQQFYAQGYSNIHRGLYPLSEQATADFESTRDAVRAFINAREREEVVFTTGTTQSINLVASSLGQLLQAGDSILVTEMEHHANLVPWQLLAHKGIGVKAIRLNDAGELRLDTLAAQLTPDVKVFAFTAVSNALGTINPVQMLIQQVRALRPDMVILVDAAQAVAHMPIDVQTWDCDFLAFSAHKLYGPTGVGVLYGKREWLEKLPPYMGGGDMIRTVTLEKTTFNTIPYKFEAGTPNIAGVIALKPAIAFVQSLGWEAIIAHEQALLSLATAQLQAIDGLRIIGTATHKEAVVSFVVDGVHPSDIATLLGHEQICLRASHHCAQPVMQRFHVPATVRASFAVYNTPEDIHKLIAGVNMAVAMLR
ncbi:MAG: cysteine desulfurase [Proteobacteria bacterium]|nr:cysteine desulfurase [Pseudomonadota bacterium]